MKKKLVYTTVAAALGALGMPYMFWHASTGQTLEVLIVDKTVPDESYREHQGITWALNHYKYLKEDQTEYDLAEDYIGFHPQGESSFDITFLDEETPNSSYDLIYIADTYGVYEEEFYGENQAGARSELIYGGLTLEDVTALETEVFLNDTPLIAEFNSFASPTDKEVQERFTSLLGLEWSGWIARYFDVLDLEESVELPLWMIENYQDQTGEEWTFRNGGMVFVRDDDLIVVLEEGEGIEDEGVLFQFTEEGESFFDDSLDSIYEYWFDVVKPEDAEVLAEYTLGLTEKGIDRMSEYGIGNTIPAVTRNSESGAPVYYFAGDYADTESTPSFFRYKGLDWLSKSISRLQYGGARSFYSRAYLPMMSRILEDTYTHKHNEAEDTNEETVKAEGITYHSRLNETGFEILNDGEWQVFDIKGVNMGMAKPGSWPGEAAITFDEYVRWFEQIDDMGANLIRIYTIHPPEFYQALWLHNQKTEDPLYIMHGVWIEEEILEAKRDAYLPEVVEAFQHEMTDVVDVIHGNTELPDKIGHASGNYSYDVSPYVLGYILGIEWYPRMVEETNEQHQDLLEFEGVYFRTEEASAFEKWLAKQMDFITEYEVSQYQMIQPISFTNWPTTDLLDHPAEPSVDEDLVSVDPNTIYEREEMVTGYFASYHVYPYYPDFLNYEEDYINFVDHRGEKNNYAGYLDDLIGAHRMPLIVAEFGLPASRGMTHRNPFGLNQGFISEGEQGESVVRLFEDIFEQGAAGGIMFTWQDEWFKRTWNTMELDNPYRRPYWSNVQTNEQRFGLMSFNTNTFPLDGEKEKWTDSERLTEKEGGLLKGLTVAHDEAYMYFMIDFDPEKLTQDATISILLDTVQDQGNLSVPFIEDVTFEQGVDFVIDISPDDESRVWVDSYYDPFYYQYGYELEFLDNNDVIHDNDGEFNSTHFALSMPMVIPSTGETIPFDYYETGLLREGVGNPQSDDYHSLSDYIVNEEEGILEMRIPWLLLNVKDPSQKEILGDIWTEGIDASELLEAIGVSVIATVDNRPVDQLPEDNQMLPYSWDEWEEPEYQERLKESYYIIQNYLTND
ncbi:MAG: hypothetical protein JJU16_04630 [Alkalibacterium sp.]|nr:hypothetical protein [Alkalibacterium sp.]